MFLILVQDLISEDLLHNQLEIKQFYHNIYLKAPGLVLPSPSTRDSVISMLSERIIGTMCLNKDEGDGMPIIFKKKQNKGFPVSSYIISHQ